MLYYKDSLKDGISIVKMQYDTIIWIKLDAVFFKLDTGRYIYIYIYVCVEPIYGVKLLLSITL